MHILSSLRLLPAWLEYFLEAVDDHSLHSPYLFALYREVFKKGLRSPLPGPVRQVRAECRKRDEPVDTSNPGAGSRKGRRVRKVRDIARISGSTERTCRLLLALVRYYRPARIVELGTSLGLGTLCLAARPEGRVFTFEANETLAGLAGENFKKAGLTNVTLIKGDIDQTLPQFVSGAQKIDFVFIDANHTEAALIRYYRMLMPLMNAGGVMVVDDIRWSPGMYRGWNRLIKLEEVTLSVDLLRMGLLIFVPEFIKTHYYIEY